MIYVETNTTTPQLNLAYEEYFLSNDIVDDTVVMLWRNSPAVIVGAFQNTLQEVDIDYANEHKIEVVRRMSGGGAVYHDLGNLCFSLVIKSDDIRSIDYGFFLEPVLSALGKLGINAVQSGRNDITLGGKKISGNAVRQLGNKILFHGTLLFDTDLDILGNVLNVKNDKIASKAIKSVRSRVTNIKEHLPVETDILTFKEELKRCLFAGREINEYAPSAEDLSRIEQTAQNRYFSKSWNFGRNPKADIIHEKRFEGGKVSVFLTVKEQKISNIKFTGDFLGCCGIDDLEAAFCGAYYEYKSIADVLERFNTALYFGNIEKKGIIDLIMGKEDDLA